VSFDFFKTFVPNISHFKNNFSEILSELHIGLHVKCPLFLSGLNEP